jgi:WD40 repeat protein
MLNEHDGAITCLATATAGNAMPSAEAAASEGAAQGHCLLASGATDGTVRVWDLAAAVASASVHVLECPFAGASVSALAVAPNGSASKPLAWVAVGYGGSSAQRGPCLALWNRSQVAQPRFRDESSHGATLSHRTIFWRALLWEA